MPTADQSPGPAPVREIAPGLLHWTAFHPEQKVVVSSYGVVGPGVLIDPMLPADGVAAFQGRLEPALVLITNVYHARASAEYAEAFGCAVRCHRAGLDHVRESTPAAEPFDHGEAFAGGIEALDAALADRPDETVLFVPQAGGALTIADIALRDGDGPFGYAPDGWYGDDPAAAKAEVRAIARRLCGRDFRHLLLTHGEPVIDGGRTALQALADRTD
ncbi:MAG: hypothetical protein ABR559_09245 [Gemmatimonadota bacterium]